MSYCERYGEDFSLPDSRNERISYPAFPTEQAMAQSDHGYDIYTLNCRHRLKLEPMSAEEKLHLLGSKKFLFLWNFGLIFSVALFLIADIFHSDNPLLEDILNAHGGLFGPNGSLFTALYFMGLLVSMIIAARPLYSRVTYNPGQLLPAMAMEALIPVIITLTIWKNFYFGDYMGTTLTLGGVILLLLAMTSLVIQFSLIATYNRLKKSRTYVYVAN